MSSRLDGDNQLLVQRSSGTNLDRCVRTKRRSGRPFVRQSGKWSGRALGKRQSGEGMFTATIRVRLGSSTITRPYSIKLGQIDVSVEPRVQKTGRAIAPVGAHGNTHEGARLSQLEYRIARYTCAPRHPTYPLVTDHVHWERARPPRVSRRTHVGCAGGPLTRRSRAAPTHDGGR